jgi:2-polyprenyl-3-methyl-5-hydroxy-6-metoxy-1,4-benzoquinol methylase
MKKIERQSCCLIEGDELEHLFTFQQFPVFMGCVDKPAELDLKADMEWWIGKNSGFIQLKNLLPLNLIYSQSHGAGAIGALWNEHHSSFAKFISIFMPGSVLEIGGGHGILEKNFQTYKKIPWVILEPNPTPVDGSHATYIKSFFDENFVFNGSFDALVHSHVFEHIYNPNDFMHNLSNFIPEGKRLIFSLPNMKKMLERKYTNCINFEHTVFLTEDYVDYLLGKYGFSILKKEYFKEDHSIFYSTIKSHQVKKTPLPLGLYADNKAIFNEYIAYYKALINRINLKLTESSKPLYLFGAHIFTQYLISFGLNTEKIICILDNDKNKKDRRLYGTNLKVDSPNCLKGIKEPEVILKAGVYNNEIKNDILQNINHNVTFLE